MRIGIYLLIALTFFSSCKEDDNEKNESTNTIQNQSWDKAKRLMLIAAKESCWGIKELQIKSVNTMSRKEFSYLFDTQKGAVMCQGAACYLALRLQEQGYEAKQIGFKNKLFSHAFTAVRIKNKWYILDPSFCITYVDARGKPMPLKQILFLLSQGRHLEIYTKYIPKDILLINFLAYPEDNINLCYETYGPYESKNDSLVRYEININLGRFLETYQDKMDKHWLYYMFDEPVVLPW